MTSPTPRVRFWRSLDCAQKLRLQYLLPCGVDPTALAAQLSGSELRIDEFSQLAEGANDHFELRLGTALRVTGVVRGPRLTATFRKIAVGDTSTVDAELVDRFHATLMHTMGLEPHAIDELRTAQPAAA